MKKLLLTITLTFLTFIPLYAEESQTTYTLTTTDGYDINVSSHTEEGLDFKNFQGKAVLLTLFGYRCPPCIREIPELIELTNKHQDDLAIVAIESQDYPADKVKAFKKDHKMNYDVIAGINHDDFISYIAQRAGYTTSIPLPLLIAVNKYGEVQTIQAGQLSQDELEFLVKKLNE